MVGKVTGPGDRWEVAGIYRLCACGKVVGLEKARNLK